MKKLTDNLDETIINMITDIKRISDRELMSIMFEESGNGIRVDVLFEDSTGKPVPFLEKSAGHGWAVSRRMRCLFPPSPYQPLSLWRLNDLSFRIRMIALGRKENVPLSLGERDMFCCVCSADGCCDMCGKRIDNH
jgi:hypothetical protein